jgi:ATP-dependent Clp protease ATP-binding subunit ClpA
MFERYTEKARRTLFFARYEASLLGSPYIDTEHLLLGILREDKALANRLLRSHGAVESIRKQIEGHTPPREKLSTSVDLPLSGDCRQALAHGAEEAARLNDEHIDTGHLLLGLLREEKCFGAQLLAERGVTLDSAREQVRQSEPPPPPGGSAFFARLAQWLAGSEARGGVSIIRQKRVANRIQFAIYAVDQAKENDERQDIPPAESLAQIQKRIDFAIGELEHAIANHDFQKARFYAEEERKERENLRLLRAQFKLEELPPRVPFLCIEIIRDERFSEIQERCEDYIAEGVTQVWLLHPNLRRAYTVTKAEGLRECRSGTLQIANPPLEMDLGTIFD